MSSGTDIRDRSNICIGLFCDCVSNPTLGRLGWVENSQADFNLWVYGLSASATGKVSLDYRVRQRKDVSNIICNLLDGLEESLQDCLSQALVSTAQSPASGSVLKDADKIAGSEALEDHSFNVKTVLKQLSRIHIAIRRAGNKLRYQKADAALNDALKTDEFKDWKADMENLILMGLETRSTEIQMPYSQNLSTEGRVLTPVQARLIHANLLRRHRIRYATITLREAQQREVEEKLEKKAERLKKQAEQAREPTPSKAARESKRPFPEETGLMDSSKNGDVEALTKNESQAQRTVTDLATDFKVNLAASRKSATIMTKATHTGRNQDYPRWPKGVMIGGNVPCPYCAEPLAIEYVKNETRWRGHVARDLAPYVCIFESCETPDILFFTTDELNQHIRKEHGVPRWACDYCAPDLQEGQTMIFDTAQDWILHVMESHFPSMPASRFDALSEMSMRTMVGPISCPLCDFCTTTAQPEIEEHITSHLHSFALRALPWGVGDDWGDSEAPELSVNSKSSSSSQNSDAGYLGITPYDDLLQNTELEVNLKSGISNYLQSDGSSQVKLPSTIRRRLLMLLAKPRVDDDALIEHEIVGLTRLYCTLFQLKEAEQPTSPERSSIYTVPADIIPELHDCLTYDLDRLLESPKHPAEGSNATSAVKNSLCTFCVDISAFLVDILNRDSAESAIWNHHQTIERLRDSAGEGCELCDVFLRQLVLPTMETSENYTVSELEAEDEAKGEKQTEEERKQNYEVLLEKPSENPKLVLRRSQLNDIALEFYCDRGDPPEITKWTARRDIDKSPSSSHSIDLIRGWLSLCTFGHKGCRNLFEETPLPNRILDLGSPEVSDDLRLLNSEGLHGRYAVATYCWGNIGTLMTTTATLESMLAHIGFKTLPRTFQDFVIISRQLGIRYLWIDALCILQDDYGDWTRQVESLTKVFENSFVNIVAASASNALQGFLGSRSSSPLFTFPIEIPNHSKEGHLHLREPLDFPDPLSDEPVASRAWILQEQLLCPRNIYFTSKQIVWECQETSHQESFDHSLHLNSPRLPIKQFIGQMNSESFASFTKPKTYDLWYRLVEQYSPKHVTMSSDRLPAISAIARVFNRVLQDEYMAGSWRDDFPQSLTWSARSHTLHHNGKVDGPSWSWATYHGSIHYLTLHKEDLTIPLGNNLLYRLPPPPVLLASHCNLNTQDPYGSVSNASIIINAEYFMAFKGDWVFEVSFDSREHADKWDSGSSFPCIALGTISISDRVGFVGLILYENASDKLSFSRVGIAAFRRSLSKWKRKVVVIV